MEHKDLRETFLFLHSNWIHLTGFVWYDMIRPFGTAAHNKQTWIVKMDPSNSAFLFESTYWKRGNYLIGNDRPLLYVDDNYRENWWKVTPSIQWILQRNQKKWYLDVFRFMQRSIWSCLIFWSFLLTILKQYFVLLWQLKNKRYSVNFIHQYFLDTNA